MSRFKLYALAQMMVAALSTSKNKSGTRDEQIKDINKSTGGVLFASNNPWPDRLPNQRQRRKLARQTGNYR